MCRVGLRKILLFLNAIHRSKGSAAKAKPRRGIVFRRGSGARTRKNGDASLPRANTHARTLATSCRLDPPLWNLKCQSGRPALSRLRHIIGVFLETALADSGVEDARKRPSRPLQPIRKDLVIRFRRQRLAREAIMAAKEISVKKYVVRLSGEERERLGPLQPIRKDLVIRFRRQRLAREAIMAAKEISVKKYVVRLSGEERERLETLIRKGKSPARRVLKARILLKAD